jgi:hypothetical protein
MTIKTLPFHTDVVDLLIAVFLVLEEENAALAHLLGDLVAVCFLGSVLGHIAGWLWRNLSDLQTRH